jgi:hypothetical protein
MFFEKIAFGFFLLCAFAATTAAQNKIKVLGSPDELKDVTKVFVDTGALFEERENITQEIQKKLRKLEFVSKPEDSDIHLQFAYETWVSPGGADSEGAVVKVAVGEAVKILNKDRVRVLMSYSKERRGTGIGIGIVFGKVKPEVEFAREFVKAYLAANSPKRE